MEKSFQYRGSEIYYHDVGSGQAVVLLHGFAEDSSIWYEQIIFLQAHCRLIVPELPGSGQSELLQKTDGGIEEYAAFVNALLVYEKVEKCIMLGHSMGGYITLAFSEMHPCKLRAFGLVQSTAFADSEDKKHIRRKGIGMMNEYDVYSFLKNTTPNLFSNNYKKLHPEKVASLIEAGKGFTKEALVQYYGAMMNRTDRTSVLEKSAVPVLFIIGSEDVAAPLADLLQQVHLPKISYIHLLEGVGHMSLWEAPEELNNHLLAFIKDVS